MQSSRVQRSTSLHGSLATARSYLTGRQPLASTAKRWTIGGDEFANLFGCAILCAMNYSICFSGLVLFASILQGCASPKNIDEAVATYEKLESGIKQYEPVGDAKIDGLARPFVTGALQTKADVDKEAAAISANPISKLLGTVTPDKVNEAFAALPAADRAAVEKAAAASKEADGQRLDNLVKQLVDLGQAGAKLAIEINDVAKGGSAGAAGMGASIFNGASGPGGKAISQVNRSIEFCPAAEAMIRNYRSVSQEVAKSIAANAGKAQS